MAFATIQYFCHSLAKASAFNAISPDSPFAFLRETLRLLTLQSFWRDPRVVGQFGNSALSPRGRGPPLQRRGEGPRLRRRSSGVLGAAVSPIPGEPAEPLTRPMNRPTSPARGEVEGAN
jgi:hypothetical protein